MTFLKENHIRQSMDGKSRGADNIMIERWFRSFKYEETYLTQYANIREARMAIESYVLTYNFEHCHSAINNQTPALYYYPVLLLIMLPNGKTSPQFSYIYRLIIKCLNFCLDN